MGGTFKKSETEMTPSHDAKDKSKITESRKTAYGLREDGESPHRGSDGGKRKGGIHETVPQNPLGSEDHREG